MRVAVASKSGMVVDQHFGHAEEFLIFDTVGAEIRLVEKRAVRPYCMGPHECNDDSLADTISSLADCQVVLSSGIGYAPAMDLARRGIKAIVTYDFIEKAISEASSGTLQPLVQA